MQGEKYRMAYSSIPWTEEITEPQFLKRERVKSEGKVKKSPRRNQAYKNLTKQIGEIFKVYRERSGMSLRKLYSKTNVSIAVISDMETGKKLPRIESLLVICHAIKMPLTEIFSENIINGNMPVLLAPKEQKESCFKALIKALFKYKLILRNPFKIEKIKY